MAPPACGRAYRGLFVETVALEVREARVGLVGTDADPRADTRAEVTRLAVRRGERGVEVRLSEVRRTELVGIADHPRADDERGRGEGREQPERTVARRNPAEEDGPRAHDDDEPEGAFARVNAATPHTAPAANQRQSFGECAWSTSRSMRSAARATPIASDINEPSRRIIIGLTAASAAATFAVLRPPTRKPSTPTRNTVNEPITANRSSRPSSDESPSFDAPTNTSGRTGGNNAVCRTTHVEMSGHVTE